MLERRQIVDMWQRGHAATLVTLVGVEGSSYRQSGARLLIGTTPGEYAGTVSGGCLEGELVRRAAWLVRSGAAVQTYSMHFDNTAEIPFGLGCGGSVDLLLEPANSPEAEALFRGMQHALLGETGTVVSFLPGDGRPLRRLVLDSAGAVVFASPALSEEKIHCARTLEPGRAYPGRFVEQLAAPQRLFVLGAGDDAKPVVRLAALLGWTVVVVDGRTQLARPERFGEAHQVLVAQSAGELGLGPQDACVLMSHSYEQDGRWLRTALPLGPRYLGVLGSRHRSSLLIAEAAQALGWPLERCLESVFAPVGMDLGGDGPEAIALSIISQIQSLCQGRLGTSPRRLNAAEVATQVASGGAAQYRPELCALSV